ncbi:TRAP transporter small permease [Virgibacillus necropolis]|uniref:C4-dicarboxylate ABC transporter permease n=1 Tax=Virgibacillus necropolis TaxID=163877 RepID=A0A221MF33_9BACI|nr:TRAP transporter small permease [Virgibacillus necropolis]ASN06278.1 C4-dicarboxylate ABC transporter permease [Virgibacillus necropolis]
MQRIIAYINIGMKHFLNILLAVLVTSVFLQVIFRFVLNSPLAWTEELARYCLVWLTFLGAAYAMALKQHIGVEFFTNLFPEVGKKILYVCATLVSLMFFIIIIYQGFNLATSAMSQMSPALQIPMGLIYMVLPISGLFLAINLISVFISDLKEGGQPT